MNETIDPLLADEVRPALEAGEELLWAGRPAPLRFAGTKAVQMVFGALFLMIFLLMYRSGSSAPESSFRASSLPLALSPAMLVAGVYLTLGGMLLSVLAYRKALATAYAVTDRRIITLLRGAPERSLGYADMQFPLLDLGGRGIGDIQVSMRCVADGDVPVLGSVFFSGIREAQQVHQIILGQMTGAEGGRTASRAVQDYLELLLQGKRTLDEDRLRD